MGSRWSGPPGEDGAGLFNQLGQGSGGRQLGLGLVGVARAHHAQAHQHGEVAVALFVDDAGEAHGATGAGEVEDFGVRGDFLVFEDLGRHAGGGVVAATRSVGDHDLQAGHWAGRGARGGTAGALSCGTAAGGHQGDTGSDGGNSQCADLAHGVPLLSKVLGKAGQQN
jgi:hypothetical protein